MFTAVAFLEFYLIVQNIISLRAIPMNEWDIWKWVTFVITVLLVIIFFVTLYFMVNEIKEKITKSKEVVRNAKGSARQQILKQKEEARQQEQLQEEIQREVKTEILEKEKNYQELLEELVEDEE